jgi:RimJ/RimL family protein N-acetyltransferase
MLLAAAPRPPLASVTRGTELRPYRAQDALSMTLNAQGRSAIEGIPYLEESFRLYETKGPAWTLWVDGRVIGCAGVMLLWPGVAHAWMLASPWLPRYPKTVVRAIQDGLARIIAEHGLVRIQAEVEATFTTGRRFARVLGFQEEGTMPKFGPTRQTYVRVAWVAED